MGALPILSEFTNENNNIELSLLVSLPDSVCAGIVLRYLLGQRLICTNQTICFDLS